MLSASTGGGRGPGVMFSSGASSAASAPRMSALTPGSSSRSRAASAVSSASSGSDRSSGPHDALSTVSPAAARRSAQARSSVVFPMPASPSTTTTSAEPPRARAAIASRQASSSSRPTRPGRRRGRPRRHGQLAAQDRGVERGRLRRRIGAQLVGHPGARAGVGGQRRGHPAAHHVGAQQHAQRRLVVRVTFGGRRGGVGRRHPVARLEQRRRRHQPGPADQPLQLSLPELGPLAGQRLRAVAADQRERDPGGRHRAHHVARFPPRLHLVGEHGQLGRVQPVAVQQVAVVAMLDPVAAQHRAQPAHQHRQLILGPGRRGRVPQRVDQHVGRHGLPAAQREQVQRQPRLPAAERLRLDPVHAEIAQHPHGQRLHAGIKSRRPGPRQAGARC